MSGSSLKWACVECLGCQRMESESWQEPEYCAGSPDVMRQVRPVQMKME